MRIIDNNKDFYDYLQGVYPDDTTVFDRRDSYELSKDEFCSRFHSDFYRHFNPRLHKMVSNPDREKYLLLQVCNTFWFVLLTITADDSYGRCTDYKLDLISTWKDYSKPRKLIELSHITFPWWFSDDSTSRLIEAIAHNEYRVEYTFNTFTFSKGGSTYITSTHETRHIPILKNIGFAGLINPEDIYFAFDEYFSLEKTSSERTASLNITDKEKIINHGFDTKNSFRGKHKS